MWKQAYIGASTICFIHFSRLKTGNPDFDPRGEEQTTEVNHQKTNSSENQHSLQLFLYGKESSREMGNATSSDNSRHDRHTEPMSTPSYTSVPELASLTPDESFSSHEGHGVDEGESTSLSRKRVIPIYWNVRLRAVDQSNNECPVCATEFEANKAVALLPCGHYFCKTCIQEWMSYEKCTCPMCRHDLKAAATSPRIDGEGINGLDKDRILLQPQRLCDNDDPDKMHMSNLISTHRGFDRNFDLIMAKILNGNFESTN